MIISRSPGAAGRAGYSKYIHTKERTFPMENVILVRYGEIHLKGLNRPYFERALLASMERALSGSGARITRGEGRYYVSGFKKGGEERIAGRLQNVFGVHSISRALAVEKEKGAIELAAAALMRGALGYSESATFKVNARRADKRYPQNSMEIARELGGYLLKEFSALKVDVHKPQIEIGVEIRERAYLYAGEELGAGGMPEGTNGRGMLLLSGGIDSPVAGYMLAKRGVAISAVHFHSFPFTGERAKEKVLTLSRLLAQHCGEVRLFVVPFTDLQTELVSASRDTYITVLMRRMMMRIAERAAAAEGAQALITGEAVGQVASQTLEALAATNATVNMPVFRPLIGMDKLEIITIAKRIGTFETSTLPYEDCCTLFVPKHPVTKPRIDVLLEEEKKLDYQRFIDDAVDKMELHVFKREPLT